MNICVVNFPVSKIGSKAAAIPLSNLLNILSNMSDNLYIIAGEYNTDLLRSKMQTEIHIVEIHHAIGSTQHERIINYISTQVSISRGILKLRSEIDIFIFFMMGQDLLIPMLAAKISNKRVILALALSSLLSSRAQRDPLMAPLKIVSRINYSLSNCIVLYSHNLIEEWNLTGHKAKILIACEHFLDFQLFNVTNNFNERDNVVGYVGRLSEEKGPLNFVRSIPKISKRMHNAEFLIGGDGQSRDKIDNYLTAKNLNYKVKLAGWISHDKLSEYLNQLKLLVLPSYTEGLPNIMLEAMACGTPVLATPVGAIPDIIKDGETGFLMENNSPECIAANVIRALEHPDIEGVAKRARALVECEFTFEKAVVRWKKILEEISDDER